MVDMGIAKYNDQITAARYRVKKDGSLTYNNEESATSYGVAMLRQYFLDYELAIQTFVDSALKGRGRASVAAQYISVVDVRTTAYIAAKCIIDTISKEEHQTSLIFRIAQRLEDQVRLIRFSADYEKYYDAICDDMKDRGINNYRRKRKVLTFCHGKAARNAGKPEWIRWPDHDRVHIGALLIDLFIQATGQWDDVNNCLLPGSSLIERISKRKGKHSAYYIKGTEFALELIEQNREIFQYLHPEFMPTLIEPKPWTTPTDGGFWHKELRFRRPLVKTKAFSRKHHMKLLRDADMPLVYEAANAAQAVAWRVNEFVLEQATAEIKDHGIGCPAGMHTPRPESPHPLPEQGTLTDAQYQVLVDGIRATRTPDEEDELKVWRAATRDWHHKQIQNKAKLLGLANTVKIARLLASKDRFYYVHTFDSRDRLYPCGTHLTPQGTGLAKGLLEFVDGCALGAHGYWHLCIHAAGVFGVDKVVLEDRIAWIHKHSQRIMDTWSDPSTTRDFWGAADKPYMFLAACKELAEIWMLHGTKVLTIVNKDSLDSYASTYVSHLPCAQDGSCNGIQHFSAMLLDIIGAKAVNMTADPMVNDIYGETAKAASTKMRQHLQEGVTLDGKSTKALTNEERDLLEIWLDVLGVDRKVCKRSTMIIPYGGKKRSCLADVGDVLAEKLEKLEKEGRGLEWDGNTKYKAAYLMHNYVWDALDTVVVASRIAMKFLGRMATVQGRTNKPLMWTTPLGFPCFQDYKEVKSKTVDTMISGRMQIDYSVPTDNLDKNRMHNAFAPNFVHSMDATHLMMTVCASLDQGIEQFALVHDSYGVPAGQCEAFHKIIREQFVNLHRDSVLEQLWQEVALAYPESADDLPTPPDRGDFDINEVKKARYFFR
jgi:DNA-directed RNA polymerase